MVFKAIFGVEKGSRRVGLESVDTSRHQNLELTISLNIYLSIAATMVVVVGGWKCIAAPEGGLTFRPASIQPSKKVNVLVISW